MALLTYVLSFILIGFVALYFYLRRHHGYLETTGLPVVPAFLCFGSPPYALHRVRYYEWFNKQHRQYGRTFARYMGISPAIVSIDPEFIKEVVVKQFENFTDVVTDELPITPEQTTLDLSRYELNCISETYNLPNFYIFFLEATPGGPCEKC